MKWKVGVIWHSAYDITQNSIASTKFKMELKKKKEGIFGSGFQTLNS